MYLQSQMYFVLDLELTLSNIICFVKSALQIKYELEERLHNDKS